MIKDISSELSLGNKTYISREKDQECVENMANELCIFSKYFIY